MTDLYCWTDSETSTGSAYGHKLPCYPGAVHRAKGKGPVQLCTSSALHAYRSEELAVLLDPIHRNQGHCSILWRCRGRVVAEDPLKCGLRTRTLIDVIEPPAITIARRVRFALLCARSLPQSKEWLAWADRWLDGSDRSAAKAADAANAAASKTARAAAWAAANAAALAAADAAWAAAANAAADAAWAPSKAAAKAADAAADAAWAAAAWAAADAAAHRGYEQDAIRRTSFTDIFGLDLTALARQAIREEVPPYREEGAHQWVPPDLTAPRIGRWTRC